MAVIEGLKNFWTTINQGVADTEKNYGMKCRESTVTECRSTVTMEKYDPTSTRAVVEKNKLIHVAQLLLLFWLLL